MDIVLETPFGPCKLDQVGEGKIVLNVLAWADYELSEYPSMVSAKHGPGFNQKVSQVTLQCWGAINGYYGVYVKVCPNGFLADLPPGLSYITSTLLVINDKMTIPECDDVIGENFRLFHKYEDPILGGVYKLIFPKILICGGSEPMDFIPPSIPIGDEHIKDFSDLRLDICKKCDYYNKELFACNRCGCSFTTKIYNPKEKCPIDKWGAIDVTP